MFSAEREVQNKIFSAHQKIYKKFTICFWLYFTADGRAAGQALAQNFIPLALRRPGALISYSQKKKTRLRAFKLPLDVSLSLSFRESGFGLPPLWPPPAVLDKKF
jgi:hypothetical protein